MQKLNHRVHNGWSWQGPLEIPWSNPSAQAWPAGAGCPKLCPDGSIQEWRLHKISEQPMSGTEKVFPVFLFVPIASLSTTKKRLAQSSYHPPIRYFSSLGL